jgi:hypothetical protein
VRFANFHDFSADHRIHGYGLHAEVEIYATKPDPPMWRTGKVTQIDAAQVQVTYYVPTAAQAQPVMYQYWFPVFSDEIYLKGHRMQ